MGREGPVERGCSKLRRERERNEQPGGSRGDREGAAAMGRENRASLEGGGKDGER